MKVSVKDGTRGLTAEENSMLEALVIFLDDYAVMEVDVEPMERGFKIRANGRGSKTRYSSYGLTLKEAVENIVRTARA